MHILLMGIVAIGASMLPVLGRDEAVARATQALASQLGLAAGRISVRGVSPTRWTGPDLGCRETSEPASENGGKAVPGYRVVLQTAERFHIVHVSADDVVVCRSLGTVSPLDPSDPEDGDEPVSPDPDDSVDPDLVSKAKKDLAERLSIPEESITLVKFRKMTWPDSALGCPQPGMLYLQVIQEGALIRLKANGRTYDYHSGANQVPALCEKPTRQERTPSPKTDPR